MPEPIAPELVARAKRVVGMFVAMIGSGIALESTAVWTGVGIRLAGLGLMAWGLAEPAHAALGVACAGARSGGDAARTGKWAVNRSVRVGLSIAISAVFLALAVRGVKWNEAADALGRAQYLYAVPMVVISWWTLLIRTQRWRLLLRPVGTPAMRTLVECRFPSELKEHCWYSLV